MKKKKTIKRIIIQYVMKTNNCKKNICSKCEGQHNKHRIELFKKICLNEDFIEKIKIMNEELISKIKKFNNELNELIILINNISNNIQNDLKIFLQISNNIINDYNLTKKNYQTISNIKVIYNNMIDNDIFQNIESFLKDSNSYSRLKILMDIYTKMYLESNNNLITKDEEFYLENKIELNSIDINENYIEINESKNEEKEKLYRNK